MNEEINGNHQKPLLIQLPLFHFVKLYTGGKNERQWLATLHLCFEVLTCSLQSLTKNILASDVKKTFQQTGLDSSCHLISEEKRTLPVSYMLSDTSINLLAQGRPCCTAWVRVDLVYMWVTGLGCNVIFFPSEIYIYFHLLKACKLSVTSPFTFPVK